MKIENMCFLIKQQLGKVTNREVDNSKCYIDCWVYVPCNYSGNTDFSRLSVESG